MSTDATSAIITPAIATNIPEAIAQSDVAVIARASPTDEARHDDSPRSYEISRIVDDSGQTSVSVGKQISPDLPRIDDAELVFAVGRKRGGGQIEWCEVEAVSESAASYILKISKLPRKSNAATLRLCIEMIQSPDEVIHRDVHDQLRKATVKDLTAVKDVMSRDQLEALISDESTSSELAGLYGLMLGICGDKDSAALLKATIFDNERRVKRRPGVELSMLGYLLLDRKDGIATLAKHKIADPRSNELSEALYAIGGLWQTTADPKMRAEMLHSIYPLLDRKDRADMAVEFLMQVSDWTVQDRLVSMYEHADAYAYPHAVREAIAAYMTACAKDVSDGPDASTRVQKAKNFLESTKSE